MVYFKGKQKKRGQIMTIKEVEKLTGLTAKSIRYYEDKGLVTVERNEENDYRSYSENEVNRLKKIKLLRHLEFSVEEVKTMLDMEPKALEKVLREKADKYEDMRERCKDKREICLSLAKDYKKDEEILNKIVEEYSEFIQGLDSEEMKESMEELKYLSTPSFSHTMLLSFMFSGPIMALFINISDGKWEYLMLIAGLAILSTALITGSWIFYFVQRSRHKDRVKKKNRAQRWIFPLLILGVIVGIFLIIKVMEAVEKLLIPENYLFYSYPQWASYGMAWIILGGFALVVLLILGKVAEKRNRKIDVADGWLWIWRKIGKWKYAVIGAAVVALYVFLTSFTVVTEDAIICHSPLHPTGISYSYSDVEKITAGVGQKKLSFKAHERKGEFFYQIELDGKTITFMTDSSSNSEIVSYEEHTYLYFEEFDQKLVDLGIPKESDSTGYENISMDQEYIDRFLRILENQ